MRDYIDLGSSPAAEDCAQMGDDGFGPQNRKECQAFLHQIRRQFGPEPDGARLSIGANQHDFGTYYEVRCHYDTADEVSADYAYGCEDAAEHWDDDARKELGLIVA